MSVVRFHEKAIQIFACKQKAEFNSAVKTAAELPGTVRFGSAKVITLPTSIPASGIITIGGKTFTVGGTAVTGVNMKNAIVNGATVSGVTVTGSKTTNHYFLDNGESNQFVYFVAGSSSIADSNFSFTSGAGSASTTSNNYVMGGTNTRFIADATVGIYIRKVTNPDVNIGRVSKVYTDHLLELEEILVSGALSAVGTFDYIFDFGPKNAVAVLNLTYSLETTSEAFLYSGDENEFDEKTVITDKYGKLDFETFMPALIMQNTSSIPSEDESQLSQFFAATGLGITKDAGKITYSNETTSDAFLTIDIRRSSSSEDFSDKQKTFTYTDVRGTVDLDSVIGTKCKLKWSMMGNLKGISDKKRIDPDSELRKTQKNSVAANISADSLTICQLETESYFSNITFSKDLPASTSITIAGLKLTAGTDPVPKAKLVDYFAGVTMDLPNGGISNGTTGDTLSKKLAIRTNKVKATFTGSVPVNGYVTIAGTKAILHNTVNPTSANEVVTWRLSDTVKALAPEYTVEPVVGEDNAIYISAAEGISLAASDILIINTSSSYATGVTLSVALTDVDSASATFTGQLTGYNVMKSKTSGVVRFEPQLPNRGLTAISVTDTNAIVTESKASAITLTEGRKNVCFDKVSSPNFSNKEYTRIKTGCGDGWSRGSVPSDVSLTITEEEATTTYNPDSHLEEDHVLYVKWTSGSGYVLIKFEKLQLVKVTNSTVGNYAGQDLSFRKIGISSITLKA